MTSDPGLRRERHYADRVVSCYPDRPANLDAMLARSVALNPDGLALADGSHRFTYRALDDEVGRIAKTYHAWRGEDAGDYQDVPGFCMAATLDQIRSQISRYLMQKAESQEIVKLRDATVWLPARSTAVTVTVCGPSTETVLPETNGRPSSVAERASGLASACVNVIVLPTL